MVKVINWGDPCWSEDSKKRFPLSLEKHYSDYLAGVTGSRDDSQIDETLAEFHMCFYSF